MQLTSTAFIDGQPIPAKYTCDGAGVNPPLEISGVPEAAKSLALIMDDPDAAGGTFTHWLVWNLAPQTSAIKEADLTLRARFGKNDGNQTAYFSPCPPNGRHRYFFELFALDQSLNLAQGAARSELKKALAGHILDQTQLMGTYAR